MKGAPRAAGLLSAVSSRVLHIIRPAPSTLWAVTSEVHKGVCR
jgi:hypothetical protein